MEFKRPRNSRDDKSGRSASRTTAPNDRPKRQSSARGNSSSSGTERAAGNRSKNFTGENPSEKKTFSSSRNKPGQKSDERYGKASDTFRNTAERGTFKSRKAPYTGRASDNEAPAGNGAGSYRGTGGAQGENKSFSERKKPYSGRFNEDSNETKRSFTDHTSGLKKSFASRGKSSPGAISPLNNPQKPGFKKRSDNSTFREDVQRRSKPVYDKITKDQDAPAKTLRGRKKAAEGKDTGLIRLNRYISNAGICSRRKADELIEAGVVSVNGVVISELGHKVDPQKDEIRYNGELLKREKMVYVLLNKPKDYITTTEDPQERRTVMHLVEKASRERIYPIGRLDRNTTGLLLMTNDGDLADKLSHPKNNVVKLYQVELNKSLTQGDLNKIGFGIELEDGIIKPDSVSYVSGGSKREIGIQIHSGKNRIVRRIFEHLGYEVVKLDRVVYANLTKKDLPRGRWRYLEESEVIQLKHLI